MKTECLPCPRKKGKQGRGLSVTGGHAKSIVLLKDERWRAGGERVDWVLKGSSP